MSAFVWNNFFIYSAELHTMKMCGGMESLRVDNGQLHASAALSREKSLLYSLEWLTVW
jgi:hypothetical protein